MARTTINLNSQSERLIKETGVQVFGSRIFSDPKVGSSTILNYILNKILADQEMQKRIGVSLQQGDQE